MVMMMAMPVVVMAVSVMVVAMPVMAMMAMSVMAMSVAVTAGEGLTRDRQRSSCQRQSSDSGRHNLLDPGHEHSPGVVQRGDRSAMTQPRRAECRAK